MATTPAGSSVDGLPPRGATVIGRLAPHPLGVATGVLLAIVLFLAVVVPALRQEPHLADHVGLLSQYLYGVRVTVGGAALASVYGLVLGYGMGYAFASTRNFGLSLYLRFVWRRAEQDAASDLLDHL